MVVCWPASATASPKGGKWSIRTLKGLVGRWGRWARVHVAVNALYNSQSALKKKILVDNAHHYQIELNQYMSGVPACPGAGLSQERKVELPHSQGIGQA